jgi:hypothetical protein
VTNGLKPAPTVVLGELGVTAVDSQPAKYVSIYIEGGLGFT